jgi:hypothetical protein
MEAVDDAWRRTLRISNGEPMTSPAIPETYPAMKSLRLSAASQYVVNDEVKYPCGESLG